MDSSIPSLAIRDPQIVFPIDPDPMWKRQQTAPKALQQFPRRVELENRIHRLPDAAIRPTPLGNPDEAPGIDRHRAGRPPVAPVRELEPVLDRPVRIRLSAQRYRGRAQSSNSHDHRLYSPAFRFF